MEKATMSPEYQIFIPLKIRQVMQWIPGQKGQVILYENRIELVPEKDVKDMRGFVKGINTEFQCDEDRPGISWIHPVGSNILQTVPMPMIFRNRSKIWKSYWFQPFVYCKFSKLCCENQGKIMQFIHDGANKVLYVLHIISTIVITIFFIPVVFDR